MSKNTKLSLHPNPIFERESWESLNGKWDFAIDKENKYEKNLDIVFDKKIIVPYVYQSKESGLGIDGIDENIWYRREFVIKKLDRRVLLKVGACDNVAKIYINKKYVGYNEGGYISFEFDITNYLVEGKNELIIKAEDSLSTSLIRGKQSWEKDNVLCWYKNSSGLWQNIYLEYVGDSYFDCVKATPCVDENKIDLEIAINNFMVGDEVSVVLKMNDKEQASGTVKVLSERVNFTHIFKERGASAVLELFWSPENPNIIDIELELIRKGKAIDSVKSYCGMRKIGTNKDKIYLNDQPLYQKLVLHQGYYPDSILTPKSLDQMEADIQMIKEMGFNGVRMHQKIEDPRFYYLADKMGLLVWGELPSAYELDETSRRLAINTMTAFIKRDYNHPSIINWVPFNESWGVHRITANKSQQDFVRSMYYMIKSIDSTRMVVSNDGWEQIEENDVCTVHDYCLSVDGAKDKMADIDFILDTTAQFKAIYAENIKYNNKPIIISEYGGIKYKSKDGWGYEHTADNEKDFLDRLDAITSGIRASKNIGGYCYTQFTDVYHEKNGLVDINRVPKVELEKIKRIFEK